MQSSTGQMDGQFEMSMPVRYLKGVGPSRAEVFEKLGINTVGELLEYYPRDWNFVSKPVRIDQIREGENASVTGVVESVDFSRYRRAKIFKVILVDSSSLLRLSWFHGGYLINKIEPGMRLLVWGKVTKYKYQLQIANPRFTILEGGSSSDLDLVGGGIYPATAKLSSIQIKRIINPILEKVGGLIKEFYEADFLKECDLIGRENAFIWIHRPPDEQCLCNAKRRLKYDELFLMQLGLALRRYRYEHFSKAYCMRVTEKIDHRIRLRFPFLLTADQEKVISDIVADMTREKPMNRLLQGDVGSGKTVAALYASLVSVANGKQVAIMAPTEILANQHFLSMERYLKGSNVRRICLTGKLAVRERKCILKQIKNGEVDIVVGTVALIQNDVEFYDPGLVVIDEQHKFGVEQRMKLRKALSPHCLVMTATPIPRTLAMTAFGDLDVSIIKHKPPGRGKVVTRRVERKDQAKAEQFIGQRLRAGQQAYFVYPRINNENEEAEIKAAVSEYRRLSEKVFTEFKVGLLHGQMKSAEKKCVMEDFSKGKLDVLVSTVVIEVGVDVPNATMMVIEGAERFGLSQLHQLRGRIGRGENKSYCFLFSDSQTELAASRLEVMEKCNDGFKIAEEDLRLRGPGEMFSTRQHGLPDLKIANIIEDYELLVMARRKAFELVRNDPMLNTKSHANIRKMLLKKFGGSIGLADIG